MNAYIIRTQRKNIVIIATTMANAEKLYKKRHPYTKIISIELISEYVIVQKGDAQ